jgi:hypothetical protein
MTECGPGLMLLGRFMVEGSLSEQSLRAVIGLIFGPGICHLGACYGVASSPICHSNSRALDRSGGCAFDVFSAASS